MTETMKVNLDKTATSLGIISKIVGAAITCVLVLAYFDDRLDKVEMRQATFEGVMEERTRSMDAKLTNVSEDMKLLINKLQLKPTEGEE